MKLGESSANVSNLSESALNSLKKSELVQKILDLKGKDIVAHCSLRRGRPGTHASKFTRAIC